MANHEWKVSQYLIEVLAEPDGDARASDLKVEYVEDQSTRFARATQVIIEYIEDWSTRYARVSQVMIEVIEKVVHAPGNPGDYLDEASGGNFSW